ncbi:helix-turn-helix domain-containing protein [Streptomyces sp. NPDC005017]|uniref:helix-turn-helix domain-containing protein n=1 Tax=Streptomyces sp. NPDC005017 TaxID=3364706 RepID=UPI0036A78AA9
MSSTALARPYAATPPPHELRRLLGRHVPAAVREMEHEVAAHLPLYADAFNDTPDFSVRRIVERTVRLFLATLGPASGGGTQTAELTALYQRIGAEHSRAGHSVDTLRTALGVAGQVARRRFIKDAYRLRWPEATLEFLIESAGALIQTAVDSALGGFEQEGGQELPGRRRARLRDALVADPPMDLSSLSALAEAAKWPLPGTVTVLALPPGTRTERAVLPDEALAHHRPEAPFVILPGDRQPFPLLRTEGAALGPAVPVARAADSLRWARHAVDLTLRGLLPSAAPLDCADHLAALVASRAGDLLDAVAAETLGPLLSLPERRRGPLLRTLLTYLESGDNAVATARRLFVHEQTVRYRLRQIAEVTRDCLPGTDRRLETMLVLARLLDGTPGERRLPAPRGGRGR